MGLAAFTGEGRFFKGNIHTHSTQSDGAAEAEAVCRTYADGGYDFLCLSDHFMAQYGFPITRTEGFRSGTFTTLLGAELHAPENSQGEIWHLLACGLPADFAPPGAGEDAVSLARRAKAAGAFLGIAHPQWSSLTIADGRQMAGLADAVEVYNTGCHIECDRPDGTALLDALLNEGHRLTAYAADDAHFRQPDYGHAFMMVRAEAREPEAILQAMKAGRFYSSRGPLIHDIRREGEALRISASPAAGIAVVGRGSRAVYARLDGEGEATLPLERFAGDWCRVVVMDAAERQAWSNPIWL